MGLGDELKKAGFIDKKKLKQLKHQERVERSEKGIKGLEDEKRAHEKDLERKKHEERREAKARAEEENRARIERERAAQIVDLVEANTLREGLRGPRSFFFVANDLSVPFLQVDIEVAKRLETGAIAILQIPKDAPGTFRLVTRDVAQRVDEFEPDWVRFAVGLRR